MMLDLHEGILEEFTARSSYAVTAEEALRGFSVLRTSTAPLVPKRELSLEDKRARYRAESKAKRARVQAAIRALRDARARERAAPSATGAQR
jgi:hypothetical protein